MGSKQDATSKRGAAWFPEPTSQDFEDKDSFSRAGCEEFESNDENKERKSSSVTPMVDGFSDTYMQIR
ncbi:hypothetical protein B9Z55_001406 [Caenorhabditis nigoni]|uniref:Uncharacterized protein n=1 Tax=Caenorhabditis nigoni TaxID=1611254 RepID=A0A2G5VFL8_9PELO|nr:hypothetical protein B9Z55_001406 [Caenorhabditis nigoni]